MAGGGDLKDLLRELRAAGPVERVRLLARSLSALRHLSPFDRKILLRMAGFEGAEALVERLTLDGPETAGALQRVLVRLEGDPGYFQQVARALADPERRGQALDGLLSEVDRALRAPEPEPASAPPPPPPRPAEGQAEDAQEPVPEEAAPDREPERAPEEAEPEKAEPEEPETEAAGPPEPIEPKREPRDAPAPPIRIAAAPAPPPWPAPSRPIAPAAPAPEADDQVPGAASADEVMGELLRLRRRLAAGETLAPAALADLLDRRLPYPWARRRALQAWLESPASLAPPLALDGALGLLDRLASPTDRLWCLTALARGRSWDERDWGRLLALAPTPAARRRLEHLRPLE